MEINQKGSVSRMRKSGKVNKRQKNKRVTNEFVVTSANGNIIDPECRDTIGNCIESQDKAKRIGWTWNNAKIELSMRLHVIIDSNWNVSSSKLEVHYQDKEQNDISGKLFFVNIVRENTLKEIIADVIRARLLQ